MTTDAFIKWLIYGDDDLIEELANEIAKQQNKKNKVAKPKSDIAVNGKTITEVIYNNPATIIKWSDGMKTVAKCDKQDEYDKEKGFYVCLLKELLGNKKTYALINEHWEEWR